MRLSLLAAAAFSIVTEVQGRQQVAQRGSVEAHSVSVRSNHDLLANSNNGWQRASDELRGIGHPVQGWGKAQARLAQAPLSEFKDLTVEKTTLNDLLNNSNQMLKAMGVSNTMEDILRSIRDYKENFPFRLRACIEQIFENKGLTRRELDDIERRVKQVLDFGFKEMERKDSTTRYENKSFYDQINVDEAIKSAMMELIKLQHLEDLGTK